MTFNATFISWPHIRAAGLVRYPPLIPAQNEKRFLFVTKEIEELLQNGAIEVGFPSVDAETIIGRFCKGWVVSVSGESRRSDFEKLEGMDEVWALCFRKPRPGWRLFGRFVEQNVFVATAAHDRHELGSRSQYAKYAESARLGWEEMLANLSPLRGASFDQYISGPLINMDEKL